MNKCPKIGDRVRYPGRVHVGPCVGTVTAIYEDYIWDDINDRPTHKLAPEREWSVAIKCDTRPSPWAYGDDLVFAPCVGDLRRA